MPDGLDTLVGERGAKISGGQRQRIAIARVLLKRPCVTVFDEATSALDPKTEEEIQTNIDQIADDTTKTAIIITHHLRNTVHANHIIVLEKGKIIERGTHQELLSNNQKYAQLWQIQNAHAIQTDENNLTETAVSKTAQQDVERAASLPFFQRTSPAISIESDTHPMSSVSVDVPEAKPSC